MGVHDFVAKQCVGKPSCAVDFGLGQASVAFRDPCPMVVKTLAVRAKCTVGTSTNMVAKAVVYEGTEEVWDGNRLVGSHPGLLLAFDEEEGISFVTTNGDFSFTATPLKM